MKITKQDKQRIDKFLRNYPSDIQAKSLWPLIDVMRAAYERHGKKRTFPLPRDHFRDFVWHKRHGDDAYLLLQDLTRSSIAKVSVVTEEVERFDQAGKVIGTKQRHDLITNDNRDVYESQQAQVTIAASFLHLHAVLNRTANNKRLKLALHPDYRLCRRDDATACYQFRKRLGQEPMRLKLLHVLQENKGTPKTAIQLAAVVGYTEKTLHTNIVTMFDGIAEKVGVERDDLLKSGQGGYQLRCNIEFLL